MCVCVQRMRLGLADDVPGPRWRARRDTAVVASAPHRAGRSRDVPGGRARVMTIFVLSHSARCSFRRGGGCRRRIMAN